MSVTALQGKEVSRAQRRCIKGRGHDNDDRSCSLMFLSCGRCRRWLFNSAFQDQEIIGEFLIMTRKTNAFVHLGQVTEMGRLFFESGVFSKIACPKQAVVKILAGAALGLDPVQAAIGLQFIAGRMVLVAPVMAAFIRGSGLYDFRVQFCDDEQCMLLFYRGGREIGSSLYTCDDADADGSISSVQWSENPGAFCLARALGNGARQHCSELFSVPFYTPEELHTDLDEAIVELDYELVDAWHSKGRAINATQTETKGAANEL